MWLLPVFFPTRLATIVKLQISIAVPPPPINTATTKISYFAVATLQPAHIHVHPTLLI